MKDVRLIISASVEKAEQQIARLAQSGEQVSDRLSKAFQTLNIKSSAEMQAQRDNVNKAYESIKNSGVATAEELARAEKSRAQRITEIDEEMFGKRTTMLEKFKANWIAISAATIAAWAGITQAWNLAKDAADGLQQRASFANLAASHGAMADSVIADLKRASGETVATRDLIEKAGTAMLLGIPADKLSKLMEIARASARVTGESITKSYEDISLAVARGSRMILDNLGIIISEEKANKEYAASLGKTADQLTDAEKKQAFMNATLKAGEEIIQRVGVTGMTAAEKMQRFEARMANLKEVVGVGLLAVLSAVQGALNLAASGALFLAGGVFKLIEGIAWLTGQKSAMAEWGANADAAFGAAKQLGKEGLGDLGAAVDLVSGKIDPMNTKTKAMTSATNDAVDAEAKRKEVLKQATSALENYARSVSNLGKEQLKIAENGFSRDLQRQEEYFKKNQSLAVNLAAPLKNYLTVIDSVYAGQLKAQQDIAKVMSKIGVEKKAQVEQQAQILTVEKTQSEQSLKVWGLYFDRLKSMHSQVMDEIKKKQEELAELKDFGKETQKALQEKFFPKTEATDKFLLFFDKLEAADAAQAAAMELTGDKRIEAIKKAVEMLKGLPEEVTEGDDVLISRQEVYEKIASRAKEWQTEAEAAKQAQLETSKTAAQILQQEMTKAEEAMRQLEERITTLDDKILSLSRTVTLTLDDQVTPGVETIRNALAGLSGARAASTQTYVNVIPGAVGLNSPSSFALDSYAKGTNYVPQDGLYQLHRGERVVTAADNASGNYGGVTIAPGAVQVIVQGGGQIDTDALVDSFGRKLVPKINGLNRRKRT